MEFVHPASRFVTQRQLCLLLFFAAGLVSGCSQMPSFLKTTQQEETIFAKAEKRREEFIEHRTSESIRWLLSHGVQNGMSKGDIDRILGIPGERVFDDSEILSSEGLYRSDDIVYSWGPDKQGNAYMLVFRDHHLVNYENFDEEKDLSGAGKFL